MDAGVVDYKLCDKSFLCETCPFDALIRARHGQVSRGNGSQAGLDGAHMHPDMAGNMSLGEYFEHELDLFLQPFRNVTLAGDRHYCVNHTWVQKQDKHGIIVGVDHLAAHMFGDTRGIVLPQTPCETKRNAPCAWVIHHEGAIVLGVPFDATISQSNAMLKKSPHLLGRSPYDEGWIFTMEVDDADAVISTLMKSREAVQMYRLQADTLEHQFTSLYKSMTPLIGVTMADGGIPLAGLAQVVGERLYFEIIGRLFRLPR
jgi:glycine cleavage system H protein